MPPRTVPSGPELFEAPIAACRFLLVIDPTLTASAWVVDKKKMLHDRIGKFSGIRSIPHITLFYADLPAECGRDLATGIENGCTGRHSFKLGLDGLKHFPDKRTIYIDPIEKDAIGELRVNIASHVRSFKRIKKLGVNVTDHPHLTIAAGLKPEQFEQAWTMLSPHAFKSEQIVQEVVLLRRDLAPGAIYEHVRTFPLETAG